MDFESISLTARTPCHGENVPCVVRFFWFHSIIEILQVDIARTECEAQVGPLTCLHWILLFEFMETVGCVDAADLEWSMGRMDCVDVVDWIEFIELFEFVGRVEFMERMEFRGKELNPSNCLH